MRVASLDAKNLCVFQLLELFCKTRTIPEAKLTQFYVEKI